MTSAASLPRQSGLPWVTLKSGELWTNSNKCNSNKMGPSRRDSSGVLLLAAGLGLAGLAPIPGAVVGAGLYVVGALLRPSLVVPAIVLTLPFYLQPRVVAGQEVSVSEAAILLGCAAVGARGLWLARRGRAFVRTGPLSLWERNGVRASPREEAPVRMSPAHLVDWAVAAFLAAALLSLLVTEYPKQSLRELRWLIVEPILVFYLARATLRSSDQVMMVLWSVVAAGSVAAAIGLLDLVTAGGAASFQARATAPYLSPNHLGLFLGRAGAVALSIALLDAPTQRPTGLRRWPTRAACLAAALIGMGLVGTLSVGAWIGTAAAALVVGIIRGQRAAQVIASGTIVLTLLALLTLPPERTLSRWDPATGTGLIRIYVWQSSASMIGDHPLLGIGLDNFLYAYRDRYMTPEAWREPNLSHPHNWVLHFWLEMGFAGLAAAVALMAWAGLGAFRLLRRPQAPGDRVLGAASAATLADFVVHGSFDNAYFLVDMAVLWWVFMALIAIRGGPADVPAGARGSVQ